MNKLEQAANKSANALRGADIPYHTQLKLVFIEGAHWFQQNHSCCCSGCTKHNVALTTEKQNSEFDDLTDEENKILEETGYLCKVRKLSSPF